MHQHTLQNICITGMVFYLSRDHKNTPWDNNKILQKNEQYENIEDTIDPSIMSIGEINKKQVEKQLVKQRKTICSKEISYDLW